jgi:voltage-gated potassium channel
MFRKEVEKGLAFIFLLIVLVNLEGVVGYMLIEGWDFLDAFYMTILTISTVGFGEVRQLTPAGRIFTVVLIVTGMGVFWYSVGRLTSFLVEADIRGTFRRRKMDKRLRALHGHIVVCGFGRNGQEAVEIIRGRDVPCVVIERSAKVLADEARGDLLSIQGDAKEEEILAKCNIQEARGLITALPDDADNIYVTLTARRLNPHLTIVARAGEDASLKNLQMVGADHVVLPNRIGGVRMAMEILDPTVVEYMEMLRSSRPDVPRLGQFILNKDSSLIGQKIGPAHLTMLCSCFLVALQRGHEIIFPASQPEATMREGDRIVVFGLPENVRELQLQKSV